MHDHDSIETCGPHMTNFKCGVRWLLKYIHIYLTYNIYYYIQI